jgi:hypothetical protein
MRRTLAILALTALAAPAVAINYGTAQGTLLAGGQRYELNHAYAAHRGSVFEAGGGGERTLTIVRLVDGEVAADVAADDQKFAKAVADGKLHAVEVQLKDETGEIALQRLYNAGQIVDGAGGDAGTWLRGEYNNKVIWGALGTDGVQPLDNEGFWRYEAFFAAEFAAPPADALAQNAAAGTLKVGGKPVKLVASRAWIVKDPDNAERTYTEVLLSSAPLDLGTARDEAKLVAAVKKQKLSAFRFRINDQEGSLTRQAWITPAGIEDMEAQEGLRWASWDFTTDTIVGFVSSDGERTSGKTKWAVEAHFNTPIAPEPAAE